MTDTLLCVRHILRYNANLAGMLYVKALTSNYMIINKLSRIVK